MFYTIFFLFSYVSKFINLLHINVLYYFFYFMKRDFNIDGGFYRMELFLLFFRFFFHEQICYVCCVCVGITKNYAFI